MSTPTTGHSPFDACARPTSPDARYVSRELSWIDFNQRVLEEAFDPRNPLLERIKFMAIFASNLDEFFMIRVSGIKQQIEANVRTLSIDGLTPAETLAAIRRSLLPILARKRDLLIDELLPRLHAEGIHILSYSDLDADQQGDMADYFEQYVFPVLTPLAFDPGNHPGHPFPFISNLSLSLAVAVRGEEGSLFARVKVPEVLPRLVQVPTSRATIAASDIPPERHYSFVWQEEIIAAHLPMLFPGYEIEEAHPFRVIRDADIEIEEDEADDLLQTIEQSIRQRRFGDVVNLAVEDGMPQHVLDLLLRNLKLTAADVYPVRGPLGLSDLMGVMRVDRPDLKDPPIFSGVPAALQAAPDMFAAIRQQDILLHHPYDTFAPVVDLIQSAADDPNVLAIKQTLYRVGRNSPIVAALMRAREQGKQVTVLVELKARFDEENNITWARALERAGVHVVYGLPGLKVHAKVALVVRKEGDRIMRYLHLGTGNYNASTARIYTDLGLLTSDPQMGADVSELFNVLTGYSRQSSYRKLLVAPTTLRSRLADMIHREIAQHQQHGNGHLIFKCNALIDPDMIDLLYEASQAGVQVDLVIRGMCCLRPGVAGLSDNIRVRSIIGPFLEHHRIYYFHNGGKPEIYMGSADLMQRNLDRRVEVVFPLQDPPLVEFVRSTMLERYITDNVRARLLQPDGSNLRLQPTEGAAVVDSQIVEMGAHTLPPQLPIGGIVV